MNSADGLGMTIQEQTELIKQQAVELQRLDRDYRDCTARWCDAESRAKDRLGRIQELEAVVANEAAKFQAETRRTSELVRERDAIAEELRLNRMTLATVSEAIKERDRLKTGLERCGCRRCDTPACNCGGYHNHDAERARETLAQLRADLAVYKADAGEMAIRLSGVEAERDHFREANVTLQRTINDQCKWLAARDAEVENLSMLLRRLMHRSSVSTLKAAADYLTKIGRGGNVLEREQEGT